MWQQNEAQRLKKPHAQENETPQNDVQRDVKPHALGNVHRASPEEAAVVALGSLETILAVALGVLSLVALALLLARGFLRCCLSFSLRLLEKMSKKARRTQPRR